MAPVDGVDINRMAQDIADQLRRGVDCDEAVKELLPMIVNVPDGLVLATMGNRSSNAASCPKSLKLLLDHGANVNSIDPQTQTACIHSACWHGGVDVVKLLMEYKADMNARDPRMNTPPLNTALAAGNAAVALELLQKNADVMWKHQDGATPLHVAAAWIASSHNNHLRMPPTGEEPRQVILEMLHNGVDPTQTEGMSKGANRAEGMTPLETFRREVAKSPWRTDENIGAKFDKMAKGVHILLEQAEQSMKLKKIGNSAFAEKRHEDACKQWGEARAVLDKAGIGGHHMAVLWNNEALCRRTGLKDFDGGKKAAEEGLKCYSSDSIKQKLEFNSAEADKQKESAKVPPTEEEVKATEENLQARKEKAEKQKQEFKEASSKAVDSKGAIYGGEGSAQKDYKVPPPFICPMDQAYAMDLGPPPPPKPWWEQKEADSDEEAPRKHITYLPAHHPNA